MNFEYCDGYTYTIKKGDTLYEISRSHKVPLALLLRSNPFVDVFNLQVGDTLCIPSRRPMRPCNPWDGCRDGEGDDNEMPVQGEDMMPEQGKDPEMPEMPENSDMPQIPENPDVPQLPVAPDIRVTWNRYVVKPGDTISELLKGRTELLNSFVEENGMDNIYLLPGVAYFVPEEK